MNDYLTNILKNIKKNDTGYLFCNKNGKPYRNVRKSFDSALKKAEISNFKFHDLRHTFASNLVMAGVDLTIVKELLGHKDVKMTLRYSHLSPNHKKSATEVIGNIMDTYMDTRDKSKFIHIKNAGVAQG
ncbi:MAG: site-specific integrase [Thermodesulfobacteriota bacterium]|nr:site-specific integrase [Thermodesulfobacteriota bacterium]